MADDSRETLVLRFFHFNGAQVAQFIAGRARALLRRAAARASHGLEMVHPSYRFIAENDAGHRLRESLDPVYPGDRGHGRADDRQAGRRGAQAPAAGERIWNCFRPSCCAALKLPALRDALHRPRIVRRRIPMWRCLPAAVTRPCSAWRSRKCSRTTWACAASGSHCARTERSPIAVRGALAARLRKGLPYSLTAAQQRVFDEVAADMKQAACRCCAWCRAMSAAARPWSRHWRRCAPWRRASRWH